MKQGKNYQLSVSNSQLGGSSHGLPGKGIVPLCDLNPFGHAGGPAGIGEALIATATGILVAVLALIIHNICQSVAESRMTETEQTAECIRLAHAKQSR